MSSDSTIKTDKKKNAQYWNSIDDICETAVEQIAACSTKLIDREILNNQIEDISADIRDIIIQALSESPFNGEFPFVNENM